MQPATSAKSQRGNRVETSITISFESDPSAGRRTHTSAPKSLAKSLSGLATLPVSALNDRSTQIERRVIRGGMMLKDFMIHKESNGSFQFGRIKFIFIQRRTIQRHDGC